MKKPMLLSSLLLYIVFNTGVLVNLHFCGTTFHHLTILTEPADCCQAPGNSCCHNSSVELKIAAEYDSFQPLPEAPAIQLLADPVLPYVVNLTWSPCYLETTTFHSSGPLISIGSHPIYLTNRVFII